MSLREITAVDADTSSPLSVSLFVLCNRIATFSSSTASVSVQLLDPLALYEAEVSSCQKPRALDCSGVEYVEAVETALCAMTDNEVRFELRWSRTMHTLTLMERSEFAMKFCTVQFQVTQSNNKWRMLLHQVAAQQKKSEQLMDDKSSRILQLETVLVQKEKLLENALAAKQSTEDRLFEGFCAILNAKKEEIRRLQGDLKQAQRYEVARVMKRKPGGKSEKKVVGAKLKRKEQESESDDKSDEHAVSDKETSEATRCKSSAVSAYRQLPCHLRPRSVQISSAEDLLSSIDDLIENEEKVNQATQRVESNKVIAELPTTGDEDGVEPLRSGTTKGKETRAAIVHDPDELIEAAPLFVDDPMGSEEQDILDMLS